MERRVARRTLLAGAASVAVAGCTLGGGDGNGEGDGDGRAGDPPDACPTSHDLGVEWPVELTPESVAGFVETYENRYYREVAVGYEPGTRLDDYRLDGSVQPGVVERDGGYVAKFVGRGALYRPNLHVTAEVAGAPEGREPLDAAEIDDERLRRLLEDAVAADADETATLAIGSDAQVDAYLDRLASLFERFEAFEGPNESATLYAAVDGTTVELSVYSDGFHGDYWWRAWYYVGEHVVRRTSDESDPRDGELLECRATE